MIYYENARCEVTAWGMNPAAIFATALFTPYWSCAEHALCIHKLIFKKNYRRHPQYGTSTFYTYYRIFSQFFHPSILYSYRALNQVPESLFCREVTNPAFASNFLVPIDWKLWNKFAKFGWRLLLRIRYRFQHLTIITEFFRLTVADKRFRTI